MYDNLCQWRNTHCAVIPEGCSKLLQLVDVGLAKPFKGALRYELWESWMQGEDDHTFTAMGKMWVASPGSYVHG
jgi:hypothetical protein